MEWGNDHSADSIGPQGLALCMFRYAEVHANLGKYMCECIGICEIETYRRNIV